MTVKEAIDILERSCGFHYNATDKCYGCLFENSGWCGDDFHESLLAMLKEQEAVEPKVSSTEQRCGNCNKVIEMDGWIACPWCGKPIAWNEWWNKNGTRNQDM